MTIQEWVKRQIAKGNFRLSLHAEFRSRHRFITAEDIRCCGRTAKSIMFQSSNATWKIVGRDLDREKLTVICAIRDDVLIVTIY